MNACLVVLGVVLTCAPTASPQRFPETVRPSVVAGDPPAALRPATSADRWVAEDKLRHLALSFAATGMTYGGARLAMEPAPARTTAVGVALLLGVGKELLDARQGGPFSLKDLVWDAVGVALGYTFAQRME